MRHGEPIKSLTESLEALGMICESGHYTKLVVTAKASDDFGNGAAEAFIGNDKQALEAMKALNKELGFMVNDDASTPYEEGSSEWGLYKDSKGWHLIAGQGVTDHMDFEEWSSNFDLDSNEYAEKHSK